jgi:hypothetical protein
MWTKIAGGVLIALVAAAATIGISHGLEDEDESGEPFKARLPPVEFLYLDGERILTYLSQLEGGEAGPVHRISKKISSINAGGNAGGFAVGASAQHETAAESDLARTESSALALLFEDLHQNHRHGVELHAVTLNSPQGLKKIKEGMLVRFVTHYLLSPGYIRPYVVVRQSAMLAALFPRAGGNSADATRSRAQRRKAKSFARQVGPDPRLTFAVSPPSPGRKKALKLLLPMRYHGLAKERSLLEKGRDEYTGGRLVVIGKVIRVFEKPSKVHCQEEHACRARGGVPEYTDFATRETWRHPLEQASNYLINHVSHSCEMPRTQAAKGRGAEKRAVSAPPLRGRRCFLRKLERQTELFAPGAVVLPLAIYK